MSNMTDRARIKGLTFGAIALMMGIDEASHAASKEIEPMSKSEFSQGASEVLSVQQQAIVPIAAFAAVGDMVALNQALRQGLDAGLSISDVREVLVQLYAYAGFPRSLNALGELMKVVDARKQLGIEDSPGREPVKIISKGDDLLAAGTANQTRLSGALVQGPLFEFAPVANQYLRTHLFGDIFERDNLDWQSREIATVSMLSALEGVAPQLQAHMRISMNIGLTSGQLTQLGQVLTERVDRESGQRARNAFDKVQAAGSSK
jgi:alkylhydroperoxidase/carboxymuconolactone decarboxylase family protein YurZ